MQGKSFRWLRGGTGRPGSTRSFPVWSQGPLRKRTSPAERWADWDRRERVDWIEKKKKGLKAHISSHFIGRPEQKSPAVVHSCFFFPSIFQRSWNFLCFLKIFTSLSCYLWENTDSFSWDLQLFISRKKEVCVGGRGGYECMPVKGFSILVCWIGR